MKLTAIASILGSLMLSLGYGGEAMELFRQSDADIEAGTQIAADVTTEAEPEEAAQSNASLALGAQVTKPVSSPSPSPVVASPSPSSNPSPAATPGASPVPSRAPVASASPSPVINPSTNPSPSSSPTPEVATETQVESTLKINLPIVHISL